MKNKLTIANLSVLFALIFLLFFLLKGGWILLDQGRQAVDFKYTLDYGEGPLLDQSSRLSRGENIYRPDISTPPYNVANYPPLFVLLQVPFIWAVGQLYGMDD